MQILQDTIIKLIVRQGSDSDRKLVNLTSGEPGYTTDTHRLYIGDGSTLGGNLVGNLFKGYFVGSPPLNNPIFGDLAFSTDTRKLYSLSGTSYPNISAWINVGGVYVAGDNKIQISPSNVITISPLSAGSLDPSLVQYPIVLSGGKISLPPLSAGTVSSDLLRYPIVLSGGKISLPPLSANNIAIDAVQTPIFINGSGRIALAPLSANFISTDAVISPIIISSGRVALSPLSAGHVSSDVVEAPIIINSGRIALSAQIPFQRVSTNTITVSSDVGDLAAYVNGVDKTNIPISPLSSNIVIKATPLVLLVAAASGTLFEGPIVYNNTTQRIGLSAKIPFGRVSTNTITASSGLQAYVGGVNQGTIPINPLSANIVLQSNQLFINFDGTTGANTYSRGISGIRLSLGTYVFRYGPLPTANIYPFIQLASTNNHRFTSRILGTATVSSLSVFVYDQTAGAPNQPGDLPLFLQINY